jgi:hypothetical protein
LFLILHLFPHVPLGILLCSQAFNARELCSHQQLVLAGVLVLSQFPAESAVPPQNLPFVACSLYVSGCMGSDGELHGYSN